MVSLCDHHGLEARSSGLSDANTSSGALIVSNVMTPPSCFRRTTAPDARGTSRCKR
jgi:hypothetical protein